MQRILYLIQKEFRQILRERTYLGLIFAMPFLQMVVLGFAITMDVKNVPLTIVDYDNSRYSRRLADDFSSSESFNYIGLSRSEKQAKRLIDEGKARVAVVVPLYFERDLRRGTKPQILVLMDGVDGNSAGVALAYVNQIVLRLQKEWLRDAGVDPRRLAQIRLVEMEPRMRYNPSLESVDNIVPGIIAVLLMVITSFLTGMSIVREKEIGTLEQLMVTPIRKKDLIIGKVIPLAIVGFLMFNVSILGAGIIFKLWIKGNLFTLYFMSVLFMFTTLGLGIFASSIAKTQQQAMFIAWFFMIFSILLSGFFIPIENMPPFIQLITYANPVRYFMVVVREIYLKGTPFILLWKEAAAMGIFGLIMLIAASMGLHKRLS